ncbi:3-oxoacyl-reductase [Xylariaceae sp. FL1651]|nr:3-oxoacyl-reductase [Xylariaceae sp. FL1651]
MASLLRGTAFITGAASGIGQHAAQSFARHGIRRLALADVNGTALAASAAALRVEFPGLQALELQLDVRDTAAVKAGLAEAVGALGGRLDVAVNNAGIAASGKPTHEVPDEEWLRVNDVNFNGVWRCQREEIAIMMKQEDRGKREGRGRIINVASIFGLVGTGTTMSYTAYVASKHGVIGLTRGDANIYGQHGIRINAICPGYVETPLLLESLATSPDSPLGVDIARTPLKRMATMEEIGDAITMLASPMASFMQGAALVADGGFTTQ